jgi:hypothetical protein
MPADNTEVVKQQPQNDGEGSLPEAVSRAWCDRCSRSISETRYKCQDCPDFDYCAKCFVNAALIHPGHSFVAISCFSPEERPDADNKEFSDGDGGGHREESECFSCAPVTRPLPALFLVLKDEKMPRAGELCLRWSLRLSSLIEATQWGCAFCSFMLESFFRACNGESLFYEEVKPWYAEPSKHDKKRIELVEHCMKTLTRLKTDKFEFSITPLCSRKRNQLPDFDRIRISLSEGTKKLHTMEELKSAQVFHSAGTIMVERDVFATEGELQLCGGENDEMENLLTCRRKSRF